MSNKLTTLGYILKRLRDSGYYAHRIFTEYSEGDPRAWTIVIDPGVASVFCTCYINDPDLNESYFELYDGGQFIPGRLKLKTSSLEVLIEHLVRYGINNKAPDYHNRNRENNNSNKS
jgi:hypothetical protein